ncbi:50S ribosomal protein L17 [Candidatus Sumerlaeota bacterium]|nr:50S ribosomal protein L17 [Candidatus Sumerlaeota bacterium]
MRHRKIRSKLSRTSEHRLAMMKNLAGALIQNERIHTTQVKASQLRPFVEHLVTLAKAGDQHSRRTAFSRLGNKETVKKLFGEIAPRVASRNGGYLRIVKDAPRQGDGALMAYIEFVDAAPRAEGEEPKKKSLQQRLRERRKELERARR